ncbi:hypothetical protein GCM10025877_26310 [Agromyces mangrovi Wang et al. 2018]|nr:hypothetical protein GCM10025877_26310 [Agromyces mangrovi]
MGSTGANRSGALWRSAGPLATLRHDPLKGGGGTHWGEQVPPRQCAIGGNHNIAGHETRSGTPQFRGQKSMRKYLLSSFVGTCRFLWAEAQMGDTIRRHSGDRLHDSAAGWREG